MNRSRVLTLSASFLKIRYVRYGLVSVAALGLDWLSLLALNRLGVPGYLAGGLAYMIGAVLHWLLSVRYVFVLPNGQIEYFAKFSAYLGSGLLGVVVTSATIQVCADMMGLNLNLAKAIAVLLVFNLVYLVRRYLLVTKQ